MRKLAAKLNPFRIREKVKRAIVQRFFVRWHMSLILGAVVLSGVVASKLLLLAGIASMAIRYALAVILSYFVFFVGVRIWLWLVLRPSPRRSSGLDVEVGNVLELRADSLGSAGPSAPFRPGSGAFGGAGASGDFTSGEALSGASLPAGPGISELSLLEPSGGSSRGGWGGLDLDLDLDDAFVIVLVFLLFLSIIFGAGIYVVYQAPAILSEAAFQALLGAALARASRRIAVSAWAGSVFRSTWVPFVFVLAMAAIFGWVAQRLCPSSLKLGEVFRACVFGL